MAKKKLTIECCDDCPNFDNEYSRHFELHYREYCLLPKRRIDMSDNGIYLSPDDCPLEDAEED